MDQPVQNPVVQMIPGRVERFTQLERAQPTRLVLVVQLEDGLPLGNVREERLELLKAQLAGLVDVQHGHH